MGARGLIRASAFSNRRAVLLVEAIIALVILISGFVIMATLFHRAIQFGNRTYQRQLGAFIAEREMEKLRGWAANQFGAGSAALFSDDGAWTSQHVANAPVPGVGGFTYSITSDFVDLSVPCSTYAGSGYDTTLMTDSLRRVEIEVVSSRETFLQVSYIGDPVSDLDTTDAATVTVTGGGVTLSQNGTANLQAVVTDSDGRTLEDVMVLWYVEPQSDGGGTVIPAGNLNPTCTFIHRVDMPAPQPDEYYDNVTTRIVARVRVEGERDGGLLPTHPVGAVKKGFTLAETIVVIFLFGAVMGAAASIMNSAYRVINVNEAKDNAYLNGINALERISSEAREAITMSGGTSLVFTKVDGAIGPANGQAANAPTITAPYPGGAMVTVRYQLSGDNLVRSVNGGTPVVFVSRVTGFNATVGRSVQISLSVDSRTRITSFDTEFLWPRAAF